MSAAIPYCIECVNMKDSKDSEAGFEIAIAKYSEKWNNVKNAP